MTRISEVAAAAKVSPATVSRVLNGSQSVSPTLAKRVREAVDRLGYQPHGVARNLRKRSTQVLGLIISDIGNPFFTTLVRGVEDVAKEAGDLLILCNSDEDPAKESEYLNFLASERVAGILVAAASSQASTLSAVVERKVPVVAVDRRPSLRGLDMVLINNRAGARLAVEHLLQQGCRRIGCVTGPLRASTSSERASGYRGALRRNGHDIDPSLLVVGDFKREGGFEATLELLALDDPPDGLFVANNLMTEGALAALRESDRDIPEDVAVVGFDDMSWATVVQPTLTTVAQPTYEMGVRATQVLLERVRGDRSAAHHVVFKPELRVRESSLRQAPVVL